MRRSRIRTLLVVLALLASGGTAGCFPALSAGACGASPDSSPPTRIAINHNAFEAEHIGHTADGRQFFLTEPFEPGTDGGADARTFVALYLFAADGAFQEARIDAFGPDESAAAERAHRARLAELGAVTRDRIEVAPFSVERFGTTFGLIATEPESADDVWWVTAEPGDYMAFTAPWDCGEYDT